MRHYKKGRKLGTDASHTHAMKKNLVVNIFTNDRIKTTLERAKEIRGDIDQVITWAKRGDVHSRRLAIAKLGNKSLVAEIFSKVEQGLFKDRPGGYSRILRLGTRRGDSATIVIMELVQEPYVKKASKDADEKPAKRIGLRRPAKKAEKAKDEATEDETAEDAAEDAAEDIAEDIAEDAAEDAVADDVAEAVEEAEVEETVEEAVEDEAAAEEVPAEEAVVEEAPAEVPVEEAPAEEETPVEAAEAAE